MAMGVHPQGKLKLGRIGFLNVLPIFHPLEAGLVPHPFEIITGTPSFLNGLMAEGELDLGVVSSIEYARHHERYHLLPNLSISCLGAVQSVLLLSRFPLMELQGRRILVTAQSHTSVTLLKALLEMKHGIQCTLEPGLCTQAIAEPQPPSAVLVIGDEALRLRNHELYPHKMDLGEAWFQWTGHPFVFALWVLQKGAVDNKNGPIGEALEALHMAKDWGRSHLDEVCALGCQKGPLDSRELRAYYRCLSYDLNEEQQKGLHLFFKILHQMGDLERVPPLKVYSPLACVA